MLWNGPSLSSAIEVAAGGTILNSLRFRHSVRAHCGRQLRPFKAALEGRGRARSLESGIGDGADRGTRNADRQAPALDLTGVSQLHSSVRPDSGSRRARNGTRGDEAQPRGGVFQPLRILTRRVAVTRELVDRRVLATGGRTRSGHVRGPEKESHEVDRVRHIQLTVVVCIRGLPAPRWFSASKEVIQQRQSVGDVHLLVRLDVTAQEACLRRFDGVLFLVGQDPR